MAIIDKDCDHCKGTGEEPGTQCCGIIVDTSEKIIICPCCGKGAEIVGYLCVKCEGHGFIEIDTNEEEFDRICDEGDRKYDESKNA